MGAVPTTVNTIAGAVNKAINAAMSVEESAVEALIIADIPFLGLPGFKQVLEMAVNWLGSYIYVDAAAVATSIVVDLQVSVEVTATQTAYAAAQAAIASGDQNAIQTASTNLDAAFASIIHFDGSSST